uniref:barstar family protein n=1 Tax=Nocardia niigatensis TaxID=209249 RepID=UPI0012F68616
MRNLNAFNDCMHDVLDREYGFPAEATGLVVVLTQFDEFARELSQPRRVAPLAQGKWWRLTMRRSSPVHRRLSWTS